MPTTLNQWIEFTRSRVIYIYIYIYRHTLLLKGFSLFETFYPLSWGFLLFVDVVLLLSVDMSQGLTVRRLHARKHGRGTRGAAPTSDAARRGTRRPTRLPARRTASGFFFFFFFLGFAPMRLDSCRIGFDSRRIGLIRPKSGRIGHIGRIGRRPILPIRPKQAGNRPNQAGNRPKQAGNGRNRP